MMIDCDTIKVNVRSVTVVRSGVRAELSRRRVSEPPNHRKQRIVATVQ